MSSADNKQIVEAIYGAITERDVPRAMSLLTEACHPDVLIHEPPSMPYGGTHQGVPAFLAIFGEVSKVFPDLQQLRVDEVIAGDASAIVHFRIPFRVPGSVDPEEMPVLEWWSFQEGKVVEIRPFLFDTAAVLAALGTAET